MGGVQRVKDPTSATIRVLFATQVECAKPGCHAPLVSVDSHGNRKITVEVAHIAAASPGGPRANDELSEDEIRGFDNLVLLCGKHHKVVDAFPSDYPTELLRAWKKAALVESSDLTLDDGEVAQVVATMHRLEQHFGLLARLSAGPAGGAHRRRMQPFVDRLTERFAGRSDVLGWLAATPPGEIRVLIADPGEGKSAVVARLVELWQQDRWPHGTRPLLVYAVVNRQEGWDKTDSFLRTINAQLADLLDEPAAARDPLTDLEADYADLWARVTADDGPLTDGSHVLFMVDGLDEQATQLQPTVSDLIPRAASPHVAVVVTSRPEPENLAPSRFANHDFETLTRLTSQDIDELLESIGLSDHDLSQRVMDITKGHALYVRFVIEDLSDKGPTVLDDIDPSQLTGVRDYVRHQIDDIRRSAEDELTWAMPKIAVASVGPISIEDADRFLRWTTSSDPAGLGLGSMDLARCRRACAPIERYLTRDAVAINHLELESVIAHYIGRDAIAETYDALTAWGLHWWDHEDGSPPRYLRQHWIEHLTRSDQWDLAAEVVTGLPTTDTDQQRWAANRYAAEGTYSGYLDDLGSISRHVETQPAPDLVLGYRCALLAASVRSLSASLPPPLLVALVTIGTTQGRWTPQAAIEHIKTKPDQGDQADALCALIDADAATPDQILTATHDINNEEYRAEVLEAVAPHHPDQVLTATQDLTDEWQRARVLTVLAPHHPTTKSSPPPTRSTTRRPELRC